MRGTIVGMRARNHLLMPVFAALLLGCGENPAEVVDPIDPEDPEVTAVAPRIGLGDGGAALHLYDGAQVTVMLANQAAHDRPVVLHFFDEEYKLLWESEPAQAGDLDRVNFSFAELPGSVPRGQQFQLTATIQDTSGIWYFATDDSVAATRVVDAAVRPAFIYDGQLVPVESGAIRALAVAADQGLVYYANTRRGYIGAVDLETAALDPNVAFVGSSPNALDYRGGTLAALVGDGAQISVLATSNGTVRETSRSLIPPFFLRVVQQMEADKGEGEDEDEDEEINFEIKDVPVQPYARNLSLGCVPLVSGGACSAVTAYGASGVSGSEGSGVMRRIPLAGLTGSPAVVPVFEWPVAPYTDDSRQDTIPALITVIGGTPPSGNANVLFTQLSGARCISSQLGAGPVVASPLPGGPVFAAAATPETLCGEGTRVVRIDNPDSSAPRLAQQAVRNMLGEDRIGPISQMKISGNGESLLLLGEGVVYLLDDTLRVRGKVEHAGALAVSWLEEAGSASAERFAVGDARGVSLYETERLTVVGRVSLGGIEPHLMTLVRDPLSSDYLIVSVSHNGAAFVVARLNET